MDYNMVQVYGHQKKGKDMKENGNFVFVMVKVQTNLQMEMFSQESTAMAVQKVTVCTHGETATFIVGRLLME